MKTASPPRSGILSILPALAALFPGSSFAEFSGADSLAAASANWVELPGKDNKETFRFQNSRLEFHHKSSVNRSALRWTPNHGTCDKAWFLEVKVHLEGDSKQIGIGVLDAGDHDNGQLMIIDPSGFRSCTYKWHDNLHSTSSLSNAVLRMHFNPRDKTLTGSWRTRGAWSYFEPVQIGKWNMPASGRFVAVLIGTGSRHIKDRGDGYPPISHAPPAAVAHGDHAYFTDFKCGEAAADISVEQPAYNELRDGESRKSFGTAPVGGKGVSRIFTIRNDGTATLGNLKILKNGINAPDFRITELPETELAPGESTTFMITFKPGGKGLREAAIHIRSNDRVKSPFDLSLAGQGAR